MPDIKVKAIKCAKDMPIRKQNLQTTPKECSSPEARELARTLGLLVFKEYVGE